MTVFCLVFCYSCKDQVVHTENTTQKNQVTDKAIKEQFIRANQQLMQKENDEMDYYVKSHKMPFIEPLRVFGILYTSLLPKAIVFAIACR